MAIDDENPTGAAAGSAGSIVQQPSTAAVSPYTLSNSDNPGSMISSVTLTEENYIEWAEEMLNALQAKRKTGFIDDSIPKPSSDDLDFEN